MKRPKRPDFLRRLVLKGPLGVLRDVLKTEAEMVSGLTSTTRLKERLRNGFKIFCFILILFDVFFLSVSLIFIYRLPALQTLGLFDLFVVLFLVVEFALRLKDQTNKRQYIADYWTDVISLIPIYFVAFNLFGIAGPLELVIKVFTFVKILALVRYLRQIQREVLAFVEKTRLLYGLAIFLIVIALGALLLFYLEHGINPAINSPDDALWYEIVTITTVGYGDVVPVTGIGRLIGVTTMITAILFSSLVTATTTSSLMEKFREDREKALEQSKETVGDVLTKIDKLAEQIDALTSRFNELTDIKAEIQSLKEQIIKDKQETA